MVMKYMMFFSSTDIYFFGAVKVKVVRIVLKVENELKGLDS